MGLLDALPAPIVAAPMAGGPSTPELVAAVGAAGGFGFLPAGYLSTSALAERIAAVRAATERPFGVNVFVPGPMRDSGVEAYRRRLVASGLQPGTARYDDDEFGTKLALLLADPVPLVSFTFGCPPRDVVQALHREGTEVAVTVTGRAEAVQAVEVGADALLVQGMEAGAHRGLYVDDPSNPAGGVGLGLLVALRLVASVTSLPLVAAGGIVDGAGVAGVLAAGAVAAMLGTAFLVADEAGTKPAHRAAVLRTDGPATAYTRAYSGRTARSIRTRFLDEHSAAAPAAYPQVHHLTVPIRATGDPDLMALWAGQAYPLVRAMPAAGLVHTLCAEARAAMAEAGARLQAGGT